MKKTYTAKQGQYLAFIHYYSKIHGRSPSEAEMQQYFRVSPPAVHQMVLTLAARGLIARATRAGPINPPADLTGRATRLDLATTRSSRRSEINTYVVERCDELIRLAKSVKDLAVPDRQFQNLKIGTIHTFAMNSSPNSTRPTSTQELKLSMRPKPLSGLPKAIAMISGIPPHRTERG